MGLPDLGVDDCEAVCGEDSIDEEEGAKDGIDPNDEA